MKKLLIIICAVITILSFTSCTKSNDKLLGTWADNPTLSHGTFQFTFEKNGRVLFQLYEYDVNEYYSYSYKDNTLTLNYGVSESDIIYKIQWFTDSKIHLYPMGEDSVYEGDWYKIF